MWLLRECGVSVTSLLRDVRGKKASKQGTIRSNRRGCWWVAWWKEEGKSKKGGERKRKTEQKKGKGSRNNNWSKGQKGHQRNKEKWRIGQTALGGRMCSQLERGKRQTTTTEGGGVIFLAICVYMCACNRVMKKAGCVFEWRRGRRRRSVDASFVSGGVVVVLMDEWEWGRDWRKKERRKVWNWAPDGQKWIMVVIMVRTVSRVDRVREKGASLKIQREWGRGRER